MIKVNKNGIGSTSPIFSSALACGCQKFGQLGIKNEVPVANVTTPQPVDLSKKIERAYVGYYHTFFVGNHHQIYVTGKNHRGQLGLGHMEDVYVPTLLKHEDFQGEKVKMIAAGTDHSMILFESGKVYSFGGNGIGQLGLGHKATVTTPQRITNSGIGNMKIKLIACGGNHSICVSEDNEIYSWGNNKFGQLGLGSMEPENVPKKIQRSGLNGKVITQVACGFYFTVVVTADNEIWSWGENSYGELGLGNLISQVSPQPVDHCATGSILQIACGDDHTIFYTDTNELWVCGRNKYGQLGNGTNDNIITATKIIRPEYSGCKIQQISCGGNYSVVMCDKGRIFMFGANKYGQLCNGTRSFPNVPMLLDWPLKNHRIVGVQCGFGHTVFIMRTLKQHLISHEDLLLDLKQLIQGPEEYLDDNGDQYFPFDCKIVVRKALEEPILMDTTLDLYDKHSELNLYHFRTIYDLIMIRMKGVFSVISETPLIILEMPGATKAMIEVILHYVYTDSLPCIIDDSLVNDLLCLLVRLPESQERMKQLILRKLTEIVTTENIGLLFQMVRPFSNVKNSCIALFKNHLLSQIKNWFDDVNVPNPDDSLLTRSELREILSFIKKDKNLIESVPVPKGKLTKDLLILYENKEFGDTKLVLHHDGTHITAHKAILAARCDRFKVHYRFNEHLNTKESSDSSQELESQDESESITNSPPRSTNQMTLYDFYNYDHRDEVDDHFISVINEFLRYLYTGEISITPENAITMISIWSMMGMKEDHNISKACQDMIIKSLDVSNVLQVMDVFINGKENVFPDLERECIEVCAQNWKELNKADAIQNKFSYEMFVRITKKHFGIDSQ